MHTKNNFMISFNQSSSLLNIFETFLFFLLRITGNKLLQKLTLFSLRFLDMRISFGPPICKYSKFDVCTGSHLVRVVLLISGVGLLQIHLKI